MNVSYLWLIPALPLLGAILNGALALRYAHQEQRAPRGLVSWIAVLAPSGSFLLTLIGFLTLRGLPPEHRALTQVLFDWIEVGSLQIPFGFLLDPLSSAMLLFITGVGALIHVYSIGYMGKDRGYARYFSYLNLFMFAMILLVLGDNLGVLFVGWEGVGLCSYLLIGFWHEDSEKAAAGMKAFVVNRIGDFGFLLGMFLLFWTLSQVGTGTLSYREIEAQAHLIPAGIATAVALLLFLGATGKSAQIPLYVWLPDAMAGPTPVSALIHAATMVTSGVYMLARLNFIYLQSPEALAVVAVVGTLTALVAATIGLTQFDIKKVLAYSTVSQLGYMFLGVGVGAFSAGVFHVVTHAFFKALLFLGAGSVIHALSGEQDLRRMGRLFHQIPITGRTFLAGWLAICGIFPFAGFFSKDEILWRTFTATMAGPAFLPKLLWGVAFLAAGLTALYMTRLVALTFFGQSRVTPEAAHHIHESPRSMTIPLAILAIGSLLIGFLGTPALLHLGGNRFESWLEPVFAAGREAAHAGTHSAAATQSAAATHSAAHGPEALEWSLLLASLAVAGLGILVAWQLWVRRPELPARIAASFGGLYRLARDKYRVDELYDALVVRPTVLISRRILYGFLDVKVIDFTVNLVGIMAKIGSYGLRFFQTGHVQAYAFVILLGLAVILLGVF